MKPFAIAIVVGALLSGSAFAQGEVTFLTDTYGASSESADLSKAAYVDVAMFSQDVDPGLAAAGHGCSSCDSCDRNCGHACGCSACCGSVGYCQPRWTFIGEALTIERRNSSRTALLTTPVGNTTLVSPRDLQMGYQVTPRATVIRHAALGSRNDLEFSYFQIQHWHSSVLFGGASDIVFDRFQVPQLAAGPVQLSYAADMYDSQLNIRRRANDRLTWIGGFRWIELSELYQAQDGTNRLSVDTINHMYGGQFGADIQAFRGQRTNVNFVTKGALLGNYAGANSIFTVPAVVFPTNSKEFRTSLLWEAKLDATVRCSQFLSLNFGYQVTWLSGIALAPDQVASNDSVNLVGGTLVSSGTVYYHGGFVGLVGTW